MNVQFEIAFTLLHNAISKIPFSQMQQLLDRHTKVVEMSMSLTPGVLWETQANSLA